MSRSLISDITKCPICLETVKKPKSLIPCLHTFCLDCLVTHAKDLDPGDSLPCPVCRQVSNIPQGGVEKFPANFFLEQLAESKQDEAVSSVETELKCVLCDNDASQTKCCLDCEDAMCDNCLSKHNKPAVTRNHRIVSIDERNNSTALFKSRLC